MLNKVRARHAIDLPVERWKRSWGLAFVLGGLAILFVAAPLLTVVLRGFLGGYAAITAIGIASGLVVLYGAALFVRG